MTLRIFLILGLLVSTSPVSSDPAESEVAEIHTEAIDHSLDSDDGVTVSRSASEAGVSGPEFLPWVPTEVGKRWTYVYVSERTRDTGDGTPTTEKIRGTRVDEVTALAPEFGQDVVRVRSRLLGQQTSDATGSTEERVGFFRVVGSSYQLVAEQSTHPASGITSLVEYESPLALLESGAQPGQRWKVGVRSRGDLHTDLEGEVLGAQDVQTPYGFFERCLVIRLTGQISGIVEVNGSRMEVPTGDLTLTEWYAPGVGLVLAKEERSQTLVFEDGTSMEYSERTQFALRSTDSAVAAVPASVEP